jgi:hypothetical protein
MPEIASECHHVDVEAPELAALQLTLKRFLLSILALKLEAETMCPWIVPNLVSVISDQVHT